ncbi:unnamed protein product [Ectocarpus fasciculatus]
MAPCFMESDDDSIEDIVAPASDDGASDDGASDDGGAGSCNIDSLSDADQQQLALYDSDMYLEDDCVNDSTPLPLSCNYMGLGQECRGCFLTCVGALKYMEDKPEHIEEYGEDAVMNFCPDSEVSDLAECH